MNFPSSFIKNVLKKKDMTTLNLINEFLEKKEYDDTAYKHLTKNSWTDVSHDTGKRGEYEIYNYLKVFEDEGAVFLFNVYIPKPGEQTTELDVVMIFKKGIIVLESKNYSGWIFGDATSKMWMQTLPLAKGKSFKKRFYNPILQNKGHIDNLKKLLNRDVPIFSLIVFSERCTLKKVPENTNNTKIINRYNITATVRKICESNPDVIDSKEVHDIYRELYQYSQVDEQTKQKHINDIKNTHKYYRR